MTVGRAAAVGTESLSKKKINRTWHGGLQVGRRQSYQEPCTVLQLGPLCGVRCLRCNTKKGRKEGSECSVLSILSGTVD